MRVMVNEQGENGRNEEVYLVSRKYRSWVLDALEHDSSPLS